MAACVASAAAPSCRGFRCLDREACFVYDASTKIARLAHESDACDVDAATEELTLPYLTRTGAIERISVDRAQQLMQCTYTSKLLFQSSRMLRNYAFWGFTDSVDEGFTTVAMAHDAWGLVSDAVAIGHAAMLDGVDDDQDNGLGLFATAALTSGTFLGEYTGMVQVNADTATRHDPYGVVYPSVYERGGLRVSAFEFGNEMRCINHSAEPNARFTPMVRRGILHIYCFTTRAVEPGEQIFVNYGTSYWMGAGVDDLYLHAGVAIVSLGAGGYDGLLLDLDDGLDLHGHVERQRVGADGGPGVDALVAEDLADRVGRAVDHTRLAGEAVHAVNKAHELHDALHLVQVAQLVLERGHEAERDVVRGLVALLRRQVLADLAHNQVTADWLRQVAGSREDVVARAHARAVVALGLGHRRQRVAELLEAALDVYTARADSDTGREGLEGREHGNGGSESSRRMAAGRLPNVHETADRCVGHTTSCDCAASSWCTVELYINPHCLSNILILSYYSAFSTNNEYNMEKTLIKVSNGVEWGYFS